MKIIVFAFLMLLLCSVAAVAQKSSEWDALLAAQKEERTALYNRQDSEYRLLVELQKASLEKTGGDERQATAKEYIAERERLSLRQASERTELQKSQQKERSDFHDCPKPKDVAVYDLHFDLAPLITALLPPLSIDRATAFVPVPSSVPADLPIAAR